MTAKTITLTGAETRAVYSGGSNAWLRNDGADVIYAAAVPGITAGSDGVVSIPAGQSAPVYGAYGTVYLLGTGSVQLIGSDYSTNPFKTSAQSGGSGADSVARAAITAHAGNAEIHVTAADKARWNGLGNPKLLINPDFAINQRGQSEYTGDTNYLFTVDGWRLGFGARITKVLTVEPDGVVFGSTTDKQYLVQILENPERLIGNYTLSFCVAEITGSAVIQIVDGDSVSSSNVISEPGVYSVTRSFSGNSSTTRLQLRSEVGATVKVRWAKLESGSAATPFVPPDPAAELLRCQRYYQIRTTNDIDPLDLRPSMGTITDIKAVEGGYAYVAEL